MKRLLQFILVITLGISPLISKSQFYYYLSTRGTEQAYDYKTKNATTIIEGDTNDILSPTQKLPFKWKFFGDTVEYYKISDNGYITFDTNETKSIANNLPLPSAAEPNNAIFAFWDDWFLTTKGTKDKIQTWTYGTAPERVHVIQWSSISLRAAGKDNSASTELYFAIRIYETGRFDITIPEFFYTFQGNVFSASVGAENKDGSMMSGYTSNRLYLGSGRRGQREDDLVISFYERKGFDAYGYDQYMEPFAAVNKNFDISASFINYGTNDLNAFNFNYQVNNDPPVTQTISGQSIGTDSLFTLTHSTPWKPTKTNELDTVKVWLDHLNGNQDENPFNDTVTQTVFVNEGNSATRNVLLEEFTSGQCDACPHGKLMAQRLQKEFPNLIHIAHHYGNGTDAMTIDKTSDLEFISRLAGPTLFIVGGIVDNFYPYADVDRAMPKTPGRTQLSMYNTFYGADTNTWRNLIKQELNKPAPVKIDLRPGLDQFNGFQLFTDITFLDYMRWDINYRVTVLLVEDNVTGTSAGYRQDNAFGNNYPGGALGGVNHPYYDLGHPIPAGDYKFRDVVREFLPNAKGDGSLIVKPEKGEQISNPPNKPYIPFIDDTKYNLNNLKVVVIVHAYDDFDNRRLFVLNAAEQSIGQILGVEEKDGQAAGLNVFPNPASNLANVSFSITDNSDVALEVFDVIGQSKDVVSSKTYKPGIHIIKVDVSDYKPGIYFATLTVNGQKVVKKFNVVK